jgi:16S rRNA (adenine1518-N6/adenine1519-N6)-dimethyltransferase
MNSCFFPERYNVLMNETPVSHPAPRQTQSYLRELFQCNRLHPKNKLGQNFLIDLNLIDLIVNAADLTRADLALEIGSGTGSLTARLAEHAGAVLSVEIDPAFHALATETVHAHGHVQILNADALRNKNQMNPEVLSSLAALQAKYRPERVKLVANLPYAVATPVISNLLIAGVELERMIVTVQWEIAEKLQARPGTKDYGALAVLVQSLADTEVLRKLPPSVFWPRPQVDSGIVKIVPSAAKRRRIPDVQRFRNFLRDLYSHRRKNLRGAIVSMTGHQHEKASVDAKLAQLGYTGAERAETLSIEQHVELCEAFRDAEPEA